jgi:hypothetical protein
VHVHPFESSRVLLQLRRVPQHALHAGQLRVELAVGQVEHRAERQERASPLGLVDTLQCVYNHLQQCIGQRHLNLRVVQSNAKALRTSKAAALLDWAGGVCLSLHALTQSRRAWAEAGQCSVRQVAEDPVGGSQIRPDMNPCLVGRNQE